MSYIHDTIIREYLNGKDIQVYLSQEGEWLDVPNIKDIVFFPIFAIENKYRIKPNYKYCFFDTGGRLLNYSKETDTFEATMFEYPKYLPSGQHIMIKYNEDNHEIIETYHSNTASTKYIDGTNS